jgi:hypothetical protein
MTTLPLLACPLLGKPIEFLIDFVECVLEAASDKFNGKFDALSKQRAILLANKYLRSNPDAILDYFKNMVLELQRFGPDKEYEYTRKRILIRKLMSAGLQFRTMDFMPLVDQKEMQVLLVQLYTKQIDRDDIRGELLWEAYMLRKFLHRHIFPMFSAKSDDEICCKFKTDLDNSLHLIMNPQSNFFPAVGRPFGKKANNEFVIPDEEENLGMPEILKRFQGVLNGTLEADADHHLGIEVPKINSSNEMTILSATSLKTGICSKYILRTSVLCSLASNSMDSEADVLASKQQDHELKKSKARQTKPGAAKAAGMYTVGYYKSILKSSKGRGGNNKVTKITDTTSMMDQTFDMNSLAAAAVSLDSPPDTPSSEDTPPSEVEIQFLAQIAKQRNDDVSPPGESTPSDDDDDDE